MTRTASFCFPLLVLLAFSSVLARGEDETAALTSATARSLVLDGEPFDFTIDDGLYATVTAMQSFRKPEIKDEKKFKLKNIPGFKKDIEVRAILRNEPAPLVVIFLGLSSKSKDPLARLWQAQLREANCHALAFDSVFRPSFNERSAHGVAGNLDVEARVAANVISAFLRHPDMEGKVTKVGLLGASYGGALALNFAKLANEGQIGVVPERVLAFSPPVNMLESAVILDQMYDVDRQKHGIFDLLKLKGCEPVAPGKSCPFQASLMRAGIGYVFRDDLEAAIDCSRELYNFRLPDSPKDQNGEQDDKHRHAFQRFIEEIVFPYWQRRGYVKEPADLWACGDLDCLLRNSPDSVQVVLAADDPLNNPEKLKAIERDAPAGRLTVLPRGGHLGFVGSKWAKERVLQTFK